MRWKYMLSLIGIGILAYLVYKINIKNIFYSLYNANQSFILLSILILIPMFIFLALKWHLILKKQGIHIPFLYTIKIYLIGVFYGVITPSKIGSAIKAVYLSEKTNRQIGETISSLVIEKVLDLIVILLLALIGTFFIADYFSGLISKLLLVLVALALITMIFLHKNSSRFIFKLIERYLLPKKFKTLAKTSFYSFYGSLPKARKLFLPFIVTIISWLCIYTQAYIIAKAFSIDLPYIYFITLFPIGTIIGMIPITVSGLGTREATIIFLFNIFAAAENETILSANILSMLLILLLISTIFPAIIGAFLSLKKEKPKDILNQNGEIHTAS